jgi:hypothetical protein
MMTNHSEEVLAKRLTPAQRAIIGEMWIFLLDDRAKRLTPAQRAITEQATGSGSLPAGR